MLLNEDYFNAITNIDYEEPETRISEEQTGPDWLISLTTSSQFTEKQHNIFIKKISYLDYVRKIEIVNPSYNIRNVKFAIHKSRKL